MDSLQSIFMLRPSFSRPSICEAFSISNQLLRRIVKRFRGGFVVKAHRLVYHSTLGSRETKKRRRSAEWDQPVFLIALICSTRRQIQASASSNQDSGKDHLIPLGRLVVLSLAGVRPAAVERICRTWQMCAICGKYITCVANVRLTVRPQF